MQTFVRAVDGGSLSAAARDLGRSLASVSRTISELESRLDVRLLHRSTRPLTPTEAGLAYHDAARRILAEVDEAETGIGAQHKTPRGLLTVTAPLLFGRLHVAPVAAKQPLTRRAKARHADARVRLQRLERC
ncbi:MAG TPA: LysR family transcriptional regulator, partial [Casimicrobiaceae bacterium]|nr:LysR family transcriptional regulator [Casimicrobiaceae bacterium]